MMKAWQHFKTITTHKMWVMRYCFKIGLYWQGLTHDLSKYSPTEFLVGMKYYQGDRSPNNAEREDTGMSKSWMHHKGRNKHHFEYWVDYAPGDEHIINGVPMPRKYIAEMVMDRISASRNYLGDKYDQHQPLDYYLKGKEKYDMQREKLAGRYKTKTVMYEALMFLQIWYFASTTIFQIIQKKEFLTDCRTFFDAIATFTQTIAGLIIQIGKEAAQISNGLSNLVIAGVVYWIIRILICGGCLAVAGIFLAFIGIKIVGLYKKYCWDSITIMVILISMATAIYFGKWIKTTLPINLLFLLLFVQLVYVGIRWYVRGWRETRGYH